MDGPEGAASQVLEAGNVNMILTHVHKLGKEEEEVRKALGSVMAVRKEGAQAREVADVHSFETVLRIRRAGEGPFCIDLKPAGLSEGPVIPVAEKAIGTGSPNAFVDIVCDAVCEQVLQKFDRLIQLKQHAGHGVDVDSSFIEVMLSATRQGPRPTPIQGERQGAADQSS